jgi:hypothetical protein
MLCFDCANRGFLLRIWWCIYGASGVVLKAVFPLVTLMDRLFIIDSSL